MKNEPNNTHTSYQGRSFIWKQGKPIAKTFEKTWRTSIAERSTQQQAHEFHRRSKRHFLKLSLKVESPITPPHPGNPLHQFPHVMPASGIGLIPGRLCTSASHVRVFINASRQFTRALDIKVDGGSPVVLYGQRDCWWEHSFWDLGEWTLSTSFSASSGVETGLTIKIAWSNAALGSRTITLYWKGEWC
jgi:hypothetical protein